MTRSNRRPCRSIPVPSPVRLDPSDELAVALHTIDDFGRSIQSADTKAGALAAVLGLIVGGLVNDLAGADVRLLTRQGVLGAPGPAFAVFLVSLVVAGVALAMTQIPRLTTGEHPCRLAFPSVARDGVRGVDLTGEAWQQVEVLAGIAMTKFRHLRLGLLSTCACVVSFLTWLTIVVTTG